MKIVVKIGGFMIEKNPNPNHNHNFSRGSTHNPNYSTILSEKSTPNINHNSTQHLYHPQPQQHHNFVAQNIPNPNHSPFFLEMTSPLELGAREQSSLCLLETFSYARASSFLHAEPLTLHISSP